MNRCLVRKQKERSKREISYRQTETALMQLTFVMLYRNERHWLYLTYCTHWSKFKVNRAESMRQRALDVQEGIRLGYVMAHEGRQAIRKMQGRSPSYLRRQDERFYAAMEDFNNV